MTPLRQTMLDVMLQRGFAARTQESYVEASARMAKHYRRDPATLTAGEVQAHYGRTTRPRPQRAIGKTVLFVVNIPPA